MKRKENPQEWKFRLLTTWKNEFLLFQDHFSMQITNESFGDIFEAFQEEFTIIMRRWSGPSLRPSHLLHIVMQFHCSFVHYHQSRCNVPPPGNHICTAFPFSQDLRLFCLLSLWQHQSAINIIHDLNIIIHTSAKLTAQFNVYT